MTSPSIVQLKMIAALLEAIDQDDEDDAKAAIKLIKGLVGEEKKS